MPDQMPTGPHLLCRGRGSVSCFNCRPDLVRVESMAPPRYLLLPRGQLRDSCEYAMVVHRFALIAEPTCTTPIIIHGYLVTKRLCSLHHSNHRTALCGQVMFAQTVGSGQSASHPMLISISFVHAVVFSLFWDNGYLQGWPAQQTDMRRTN